VIDWLAFVVVALASLVGACLMVGLFAIGLRLLSSAGHPVHVEPAGFTDAITVVSPERAAKEAQKVRKARKRSQLTPGQKRWALAAGRSCFVACAAIGLFGLYLIIPAFH
jgi:hypothetical protein